MYLGEVSSYPASATNAAAWAAAVGKAGNASALKEATRRITAATSEANLAAHFVSYQAAYGKKGIAMPKSSVAVPKATTTVSVTGTTASGASTTPNKALPITTVKAPTPSSATAPAVIKTMAPASTAATVAGMDWKPWAYGLGALAILGLVFRKRRR